MLEIAQVKPRTSCGHSRELPEMADGKKLQLLSDDSSCGSQEGSVGSCRSHQSYTTAACLSCPHTRRPAPPTHPASQMKSSGEGNPQLRVTVPSEARDCCPVKKQ